MPCYDPRGDEDTKEKLKDYQITVRLACAFCTALEDSGVEIPKWASKWWKEHKKQDEERKKEEDAQKERQRLRASALKKLTPEERKAMGLQ